MVVLDRAGKLLLGTFFWLISLLVLALGVFLFQWNPEHISKGGGVHIESKQFVIDFQQNHKRLPEEEEYYAWSHENDHGEMPCDYHKADFPSDLIRLAGKPPQGAFYFTCWDYDVSSYYASWYENGMVGLITDRDYYWGGSRLMHSIIFIGLFLGFGLVASFFYSLAFEKSTTRPKNPA